MDHLEQTAASISYRSDSEDGSLENKVRLVGDTDLPVDISIDSEGRVRATVEKIDFEQTSDDLVEQTSAHEELDVADQATRVDLIEKLRNQMASGTEENTVLINEIITKLSS
jgi:hypothetical protein